MARIPSYLAATKKALALGGYVKRRGFPLKEYFESIDSFRAGCAALPRRAGGEKDDDGTLVVMLAQLVDRDEEFLTFVVDERPGYDLTGDRYETNWKLACEALAHTILHEYELAVAAGDWPDG